MSLYRLSPILDAAQKAYDYPRVVLERQKQLMY